MNRKRDRLSDLVRHDPHVEECVLGALLVDGSLLAEVPFLEEQDFWQENCRRIFAACQALSRRGEVVNQLTVAHELEQRGQLEEIGLAYLSELVLNLPTTVGFQSYARIVRIDALFRRLGRAAEEIKELAGASADFDHALAQAEALLRQLRDDAGHLVSPARASSLQGRVLTRLTVPEEVRRLGMDELWPGLSLVVGTDCWKRYRFLLRLAEHACAQGAQATVLFAVDDIAGPALLGLSPDAAKLDRLYVYDPPEMKLDALIEVAEKMRSNLRLILLDGQRPQFWDKLLDEVWVCRRLNGLGRKLQVPVVLGMYAERLPRLISYQQGISLNEVG